MADSRLENTVRRYRAVLKELNNFLLASGQGFDQAPPKAVLSERDIATPLPRAKVERPPLGESEEAPMRSYLPLQPLPG